ncbi:MAG: ubiquinol-cytochrome c reductase iron-sulfur subunit [Vulcanimicrobiaceae bacterium]
MAEHQAQAYQDPGSPEEQSRRTFLANVTVGVGTIIGLVVAVPVLGSLVPESLLDPEKSAGGVWAPLSATELTSLQAAATKPAKMDISFRFQDGYLPPSDQTTNVWGVRMSADQIANFKTERPDLFRPGGETTYDPFTQVGQIGFVIFSPICPHLGCAYQWDSSANIFACPCHGSKYTLLGKHIAGPAQRGLDPLPFRDKSGTAAVTWIVYKGNDPDRVVVSYT